MSSRPATDDVPAAHLHRTIYVVMVLLAVWLVLSVWGFFGGHGYTGLALMVVSLFVMVAVGLPYKLWRIGAKARGRRPPERPGSLADWLGGDFDTWPGRIRAKDAAIEVLLPIAAVAIGMSVFAMVLLLDTA